MRHAKPKSAPAPFDQGFLRTAQIKEDLDPNWDEYPYAIPAIRNLGRLKLHPKVTYFVGENGTGKSTLIEAIAVAAGFNPEGGGKSIRFATKRTESELVETIQLVRGARRERDGYFLRAESFYNVATAIDDLGVSDGYGGKSLHEYSHGESFLALFDHRFRNGGLYILDEPEAALSVSRQFALITLLDEQVQTLGSQFLISTHSPILLSYPDSIIYRLDETGIAAIAYEQAESYEMTFDFLNNRDVYLKELAPEYYRKR
jgi:predicted ATPase